MRSVQTKLYSLAAPLALLPLMDFSFSEVGDFLRGVEFRSLLSETIIQVISGVADAVIFLVINAAFGVFGG